MTCGAGEYPALFVVATLAELSWGLDVPHCSIPFVGKDVLFLRNSTALILVVGRRRAPFAQLVERVYLDFDYHTWLENMDKAFASWKQANQPV